MEDLNRLNPDTKSLGFLDEIFSIPFSYISKIESSKNSNKIVIHYGKKSDDYILTENENYQNEIFNSLRNILSRLSYVKRIPTIWEAAKPSIFATLIVLALFIYTFIIASEIDNGVEFIPTGGLGGIVLIIAQLGRLNTILIFLPLLIIAVFTLINKIKSRKETEYLL